MTDPKQVGTAQPGEPTLRLYFDRWQNKPVLPGTPGWPDREIALDVPVSTYERWQRVLAEAAQVEQELKEHAERLAEIRQAEQSRLIRERLDRKEAEKAAHEARMTAAFGAPGWTVLTKRSSRSGSTLHGKAGLVGRTLHALDCPYLQRALNSSSASETGPSLRYDQALIAVGWNDATACKRCSKDLGERADAYKHAGVDAREAIEQETHSPADLDALRALAALRKGGQDRLALAT